MKIKTFSMEQRMAFLVFFLVVGGFLFSANDAAAGISHSLRGWIWGGTEATGDATINGNETGLGWVSTNSANCDTDFDGLSNGSTGCPSSGTSVADYGLHIPLTDGDINGYIWSENIGWISFESVDTAGCPEAPCQARREGDTIRGWARVLAIRSEIALNNDGGFLGWIKLHSESGDAISYGLTIDTAPDPDTVDGYAWSDEFGWLDAHNLTLQANESVIICPQSATTTVGGELQLRAYYRASTRLLSCADLLGATDVTTDASTSWNSNDPTIATVDSSSTKGLATGVAEGGSVSITMTYLDNSTTMILTIINGSTTCGDGTLDAGESCDEGADYNGSCITAVDNDADGATCSAACEINVCHCAI